MKSLLAALVLLSATATEPKTPTAHEWMFESRTDAATDVVTYTVSIRSQASGVLQIYCNKGDKVSLRVLVASTQAQKRLQRYDDLIYRYDSSPAIKSKWVYLNYNAIIPDTEHASEFLLPMLTSKRLLVRMLGVDGSQADEFFYVEKAAPSLNRLFTACKA